MWNLNAEQTVFCLVSIFVEPAKTLVIACGLFSQLLPLNKFCMTNKMMLIRLNAKEAMLRG